MPGEFDSTDFVDADYEAARQSQASATAAPAPGAAGARPPSREELGQQVTAAQQQLAELKRAQEELERERATLEEARRRRLEFEQGREEMRQHLTRGIGLIEESERSTRRDAEQMARTLAGLREALDEVQAIQEQGWTAENYPTELTRALTTLENARLEWNAAQLKWVALGPQPAGGGAAAPAVEPEGGVAELLRPRTFGDLCRLGFALTWPVAAALGAVVVLLLILVLRS